MLTRGSHTAELSCRSQLNYLVQWDRSLGLEWEGTLSGLSSHTIPIVCRCISIYLLKVSQPHTTHAEHKSFRNPSCDFEYYTENKVTSKNSFSVLSASRKPERKGEQSCTLLVNHHWFSPLFSRAHGPETISHKLTSHGSWAALSRVKAAILWKSQRYEISLCI